MLSPLVAKLNEILHKSLPILLGRHVTDDDFVVGVAADDLFDLLRGSLSGWQEPGGVTVGVVEVQEVYFDVVPEARLT